MAQADPSLAAGEFASEMTALGYQLDFSIASLKTEIDKILGSELFRDQSKPDTWAYEASLDAYVGEVLCRSFDGLWKGSWVNHHSGVNLYTSYIEFGEYIYKPSLFLGYRISNGEKEHGTFEQHLARVLPDIQRRKQA